MKVNSTGSGSIDRSGDVEGTGRASEIRSRKHKKGPGKAEGGTDGFEKVEISSRGKESMKAKAIAHQAPDVREDRIQKLKEAIKSGSYKVDTDAVAEKMLAEHLSGPR